MINQEKIGKFIAALRKEKKMTQEQLAEKLGVSNRSVSRWENGKTMPDLSLLPLIGEVLGVSISELLNGESAEKEQSTKNPVSLVIQLSEEEKRRKAKVVNGYFLIGLFCIVIVILHGQFGILNFIEDVRMKNFLSGLLTGLGLVCEIAGFVYNSRERKLSEQEVKVLSSTEELMEMKTAEEMLQYAKKSQKAELKQYEKSFAAIEEKLLPGETVIFSMVANTFCIKAQQEGGWKPWHIGLAVTGERLLICGEGVRGRFMTFYDVEAFQKKDFHAVDLVNRKLAVKSPETVILIEGEKLEDVKERLEAALRK